MLRQCAGARTLLAFDFDGTLAPIVSRPGAVRMRDSTRAILSAVADRVPCAVISGRSLRDLGRRVRGVHTVGLVGNHGLECDWDGRPSRELSAQMRDCRRSLRASLGLVRGMVIEDKRFSVAIHFRQADDRRKAQRLIRDALSTITGIRTVPGNCVFDVLPADSGTKATALLRLMGILRTEVCLYIGDDVTDEDVFRLRHTNPVLAIRVGKSCGSQAAYFIHSQREIDRVLRMLLALQQPHGGREEEH
ncbi:MAG: trehalose-phosphatase [Acidobacteriota bacterium]